jgi:hypothetical protein
MNGRAQSVWGCMIMWVGVQRKSKTERLGMRRAQIAIKQRVAAPERDETHGEEGGREKFARVSFFFHVS